MSKCLYYDKTLQKNIPCNVVPNKLYVINGARFCKITYDGTLLITYNTNMEELFRYSSDMVNIMDLYPANNQTDIDYAMLCIPNKISNDHKNNELLRFESLVNMITDVSSIKTDFFYKIADFLSYDLLFFYLSHDERVFMLTIATYSFTPQTIAAVYVNGSIPVHAYLRSIQRIFNKFPEDSTVIYLIQNIRNLSEFSDVIFPLRLNIPVLKANINMFTTNNLIT